jgi:hypothetical protein
MEQKPAEVVGETSTSPTTPTPSSSPVSKATKRTFLIGFFGFIGVVIVLGLGFSIYRVYAQAPLDKFSLTIAKVLRLPALKVNGNVALYSDYADDMAAIKAMRIYDQANKGQSADLTDTQLSDQVLFRLVNNILVSDLAKRYNVTVGQSDIDYIKTQILEKEFGTLDAASKAIQNRYGWSLATFEQKVIKPFVLQQKLGSIINSDTSTRSVVEAQAQAVLNQIKAGANFASSAQQFGQDATAPNGGELGWFGKGEMVPAFETAAFALKKGELSPVLVESSFGYHILQVEDKKVDKVKDATTNKLVSKDLVKARHILFMFPTLEKKLNDEITKATINLYLKLHNPFAGLTGNK